MLKTKEIAIPERINARAAREYPPAIRPTMKLFPSVVYLALSDETLGPEPVPTVLSTPKLLVEPSEGVAIGTFVMAGGGEALRLAMTAAACTAVIVAVAFAISVAREEEFVAARNWSGVIVPAVSPWTWISTWLCRARKGKNCV